MHPVNARAREILDRTAAVERDLNWRTARTLAGDDPEQWQAAATEPTRQEIPELEPTRAPILSAEAQARWDQWLHRGITTELGVFAEEVGSITGMLERRVRELEGEVEKLKAGNVTPIDRGRRDVA